ncbi:hypothetical protein EYF80_021603 [Liparis tanakae]|uniref:Uncharacterized protein n=1 Tax=Liparis tanakae TaxID=230148 RepID=A0A4Z2HR60_9TELE|nr:hypothetical protein EYF80_021603 [Liparis tanakae]
MRDCERRRAGEKSDYSKKKKRMGRRRRKTLLTVSTAVARGKWSRGLSSSFRPGSARRGGRSFERGARGSPCGRARAGGAAAAVNLSGMRRITQRSFSCSPALSKELGEEEEEREIEIYFQILKDVEVSRVM